MRFRIPNHVDFRVVHDEIVVLDVRSDLYLALNPTAALIWTMLSNKGTLEEVVAELTDRFGIENSVATTELHRHLDDLVARGLLEPVDA